MITILHADEDPFRDWRTSCLELTRWRQGYRASDGLLESSNDATVSWELASCAAQETPQILMGRGDKSSFTSLSLCKASSHIVRSWLALVQGNSRQLLDRLLLFKFECSKQNRAQGGRCTFTTWAKPSTSVVVAIRASALVAYVLTSVAPLASFLASFLFFISRNIYPVR